MKISDDQLARQLEAVLGTGAVTGETSVCASHTVDGRPPSLVCVPETPEQVAAALRVCGEAEAAVTPWGGGTAMAVGNLPARVEVIIGLDRLHRTVEHDDANLTLTVQAGMSLRSLQESAAGQKQFLSFDAPHPSKATVGGVIASNLNGPRRSSQGAVRDLVIGMRVALASGEQIKAGGKVVKNVAGYDMCKLFVGSLGTLGIITEATLRMAPLPEAAATLVATGTSQTVDDLVSELSRSQLNPTAVFVANSPADNTSDALRREWTLAVWSEGFEETVERHLRDVQTMAKRMGLRVDRLRDQKHQRYWDEVRDFPLRSERLVYRVTVPRLAMMEVMKEVAAWKTADFDPMILGDVAAGTIWVAAVEHRSSVEQFAKLITLARARGGYAVMLAGSPACKEGVDIWGSPPPGLPLMREIKRQFDPKGILNPGRFVSAM